MCNSTNHGECQHEEQTKSLYRNPLQDRRIQSFENCYVIHKETKTGTEEIKQLISECFQIENYLYKETNLVNIQFLECLLKDAQERLASKYKEIESNASSLGSIGILPSTLNKETDNDNDIPYLNEAIPFHTTQLA